MAWCSPFLSSADLKCQAAGSAASRGQIVRALLPNLDKPQPLTPRLADEIETSHRDLLRKEFMPAIIQMDRRALCRDNSPGFLNYQFLVILSSSGSTHPGTNTVAGPVRASPNIMLPNDGSRFISSVSAPT
jgi:hypothetical protein